MTLHHFPSLADLATIKETLNSQAKPQLSLVKTPEWSSSHVPGFPAALEAIMKWIDEGNTAHPGFKFAQRSLKLSDEVTWSVHAEWKQGILSEFVKQKQWRPEFSNSLKRSDQK